MTVMHIVNGQHALPRCQRGMSLIELMIAMTLGIFIVLGITTLFVQNKQSYRQDEMLARMQEDARYALNTMVSDIELIGFWTDVHNPTNTTAMSGLPAGPESCNGSTVWMYTPTVPVVAFESSSGSINTRFGCISNGDHQANSDAIAINRTLGTAISQKDIDSGTAALESDVIYMMSNGMNGALMQDGMTVPGMGGTISYWQYVPRVYYVRNHSFAAGDGIPSLCHYEINYSGTPDMEETCIARGVESLQVEYGIDLTGDGVANRYLANPTVAQLNNGLVSVRVHLLMRSVERDPNYTNNKTYTLGNLVNYEPKDNFYRRVYTTTVLVRNTRSLRCLNTGLC